MPTVTDQRVQQLMQIPNPYQESLAWDEGRLFSRVFGTVFIESRDTSKLCGVHFPFPRCFKGASGFEEWIRHPTLTVEDDNMIIETPVPQPFTYPLQYVDLAEQVMRNQRTYIINKAMQTPVVPEDYFIYWEDTIGTATFAENPHFQQGGTVVYNSHTKKWYSSSQVYMAVHNPHCHVYMHNWFTAGLWHRDDCKMCHPPADSLVHRAYCQQLRNKVIEDDLQIGNVRDGRMVF